LAHIFQRQPFTVFDKTSEIVLLFKTMSEIHTLTQQWYNSDEGGKEEFPTIVDSNDWATSMPGMWLEIEACTSEECFPTPNDVLCGKERLAISHVGNKRYRHLIETNRLTYQTASSRHTKTEITRTIEDNIRGCGGRFLKLNEETGKFEELSGAETHEKVSHALRSARDKSQSPPRQKRTVAKYSPTPEEEQRFQRAVALQKAIYEKLLKREDNGPETKDLEGSEMHFE
jgi:hypothetical protein